MVDRAAPGVSRRAILGGALGALALASLPSLAGCSSAKAPRTTSRLQPFAVDLARQEVSLTSVSNLSAVVAGMRTLSAELHRVTATVADNWTVSPLSMAVAFGMLRAGCRGSSAREVDEVFGFPPGPAPQGSPHAALNALTAHLITTGPVATTPGPTPPGKIAPDPIIAIANGLF